MRSERFRRPFDSGRPPRVGYVVKRFPRYSETFIVNEILAHEAAGWEIEIFSLRPPNDTHFQDALCRVRAPVCYLSSDGIKGVDFWAAANRAAELCPELWRELPAAAGEDARDVYQAFLLAEEATRRGVGHLHAHFASSPTSVARLAARFAGLPYTFTAHAKDIFHESVRPADIARKLADADAVVTVSDYNLEFLRRSYGSAAARVRRIYNGLDLTRFAYGEPRERPPAIVAVGRLVEKKGFADLVAACSLLAGWGRDFRCEIIGTGPLEGDLRALIERHGLRGRVSLVGPRPQSEIVDRIRDASLFAAPCVVGGDGNRDGLPTTVLESMALGTPCVSTDVTGIPEVLQDGETGLLVAQNGPADLAVAMARLLADTPLQIRLARAARRTIERDFDVVKNTAILRPLFEGARETDRTESAGARSA